MRTTLRLKDGFPHRAHLRDDVKELQRALSAGGYAVEPDGLFGPGTAEVLKKFQRDHGLTADGIAGKRTWEKLGVTVDRKPPATKHDASMTSFRGDFAWVHEREGHAGKPYWPGGASGVTLDPGIDLGHAKPSLIDEAYGPLLSSEQRQAIEGVLGVRGEAAKAALARDTALKGIRISRAQADALFHFAAEPYWKAIVKRFPALAHEQTPASVQTVMLSLAYNRGARNKGLAVLEDPLASGNWERVAELIGGMQQDHKLAGIRKRRRMEADLIRTEMA